MDKIEVPIQWMEVTPGRCKRNPKSLEERLAELKENIYQVSYLVRGNMRKRTFGLVLGNLWHIIEPILLAAIYYFLIVVVFNMPGSEFRFLFLFTSIIFWFFHARLLVASSNLLGSRANILRQTSFPLQMIIYEFVGTELALFVFKILVLFAFLFVNGIYPNAAWISLPFIFITQLIVSMSLGLILASLGIFIKDLPRILPVLVRFWWYLSPGIYGVSRVPERFLPYFKFNPFAHILPAYHSVLLNGKFPSIMPLFITFVIGIGVLILGAMLFNRCRYYFYKHS